MSAREQPEPTAGIFSSDKQMSLPLGPRIEPRGVRGYPIDLRVKAVSTHWLAGLPEGGSYYVAVAQYGLGCYERWLAGDGDIWLQTALETGRFLVSRQGEDGSWLHTKRFPHTFPLPDRWCCGMAQGQAASLLIRLHGETADESLAASARAAINPLLRSVDDGGVSRRIGIDGWWPEEYPTSPPSFVLNGAIFAWWGLRDIGLALGEAQATHAFEAGVDTLVANLGRFDLGWWTLYCLYPFPMVKVASSFYQALHVTQLEAMHLLAPRKELIEASVRWAAHLRSPSSRRRALAHKVAFRLMVPRNRLLAYRMPWGPSLTRWPETTPAG